MIPQVLSMAALILASLIPVAIAGHLQERAVERAVWRGRP